MLKLVEIYEPMPTKKEVDRENEMFRKAFRRMSDASLEKWIDDHARAGDYGYVYMLAWDEHCRRGE